jgi:hypothetical protein
MTEVWAPVPGYEGRYDVSADGQIMRVRNVHGATPGRLIGQDVDARGYSRVTLYSGTRGTAKTHFIHRLVAAAFLGPRPKGYQVNHRDANKLNNDLDNLEYVTPKQNIEHAERLGLRPKKRGVEHPGARLTDDDVRAIRSRRPSEPLAALAAEYGIGIAQVSRIASRLRWAHLGDTE